MAHGVRLAFEAELDAKLREYAIWVTKGAPGTAIIKLGEGLLMCNQPGARAGMRDQFVEEIKLVVTPTVLSAATTEIVRKWTRAEHIISIGTKFEWEELVLLLALRIEVELALNVLVLFGIESKKFDLAHWDEELRKLGLFRENRSAFLSAIRTVRKNWGVPIEDRWSP